MTTDCSFYNALHWDKTGSVGSLLPLDSTDANGTAFQFGSSTCTSTGPIEISSSTLTYGDLVSGTLALLTFSIVLYWFFTGTIRGHKIRT